MTGGFALAASWVWGEQHEIVSFCEIEPFPQKVLKKHWPDVPIHDDIKTMKGDSYGRIDLISGGFPCQPYSCAGKQKGKEDDRALWPEMFRIIQEAKPNWVIGENVAGFVNMGLDDCLSDLESEGYETTAFIIPACSVNAPHRRDRVWIVAKSDCCGITQSGIQHSNLFTEPNSHASNPTNTRTKDLRQGWKNTILQNTDVANTCQKRSQRRSQLGQSEKGWKAKEKIRYDLAGCNRNPWKEPWIEAASRFCKSHYGVSDRLVRCSLTYPETNGMIGFILMLRRYYYGTSKEERTREVLPVLREAFGEESVQRCFGKFSKVFTEENLWCAVHGEDDGEREEDQGCLPESCIEISEEELRKMRDGQKCEHTSQGRGLDKQCSCEFDNIVFELSHEITLGEWKRNAKKAETVLFNMWQESGGERFLHEPLPALYEIWRSITDKEIGTFRRHIDKRDLNRVDRLKSLGNAIVPQVVYPIMKAIKDIEDTKQGELF